MKRIITLALVLALAMSAVACSNNTDSSTDTTPEVENEVVTPDVDMTPEVEPEVESDTESEAGTTAEANAYANIIADARTDEENEAFMVIFPSADGYSAIHGFSADYEPEYLTEDVTNFMAPMLGFDVTLAEDFAFSLSTMMTHSYGIAIVKPATDADTDAIVAGLETFVAQQITSFQNYLPDQYDIALAATVTVADSGEVILVCAPDSANILASIEAALAA